MMGLPIKKLIVATNENDVLHEFFQTGIYRVRKSSETLHTSSPSMDISKASNFERFIYDLLKGDTDRVRQLFHKVEREGGFDLSGKPGSDGNEFVGIEQFGFLSGKSTHTDRIKTIQDAAARYQLVVDTHTADGIKVARDHIEQGVPMIVLETALPAKFNETIREALGRDAERPAGFENIESLPQRFDVMAADAAEIKRYVATRTGL
jgi:threonine synthase